MRQRLLCLMLVPALLMAQWGGARQCHQCSPDSARTPHIHLASLLAFFSHAEQTSTCCCHHHDTDNCGDHEEEGSVPTHDEPIDHHDGSDAVYLPAPLAQGWLTERTVSMPDLDFATLAETPCEWTRFIDSSQDRTHHPPPLSVECPLYLRTLAILI